MRGQRPTVARVDLSALAANFAEARRLAGARAVIAVVKADAYGHGAVPVARQLVACGCRSLAVLSVAEAEPLRQAGLAVPLLVLGGVAGADEAEAALALRVTPVVHHAGHVAWLRAAARSRRGRAAVQVEIDTGMHRMGVPDAEALGLIAEITAVPELALSGVFTHLACADEPDRGPSFEQVGRFRAVLEKLAAQGIRPGQVHVANSGGLLSAATWGEAILEGDAVRPGLLLYGASPAPHLDASALRPVMTLATRVAAVRRIAPGDPVGYGATHRAREAAWIVTVPAGYADGVLWASGNRGSVLVRGRRRPIVGRVSMDYVTIDVGPEPVELGEEVIFFGVDSRGERLPVEEAARAAGTIPYELLVRVGRRVPREVVS